MNLATYTIPECDNFRRLCNFTAQERAVFDLRARDKSLVEISLALHISPATVSRRLKNIRQKIARL